MSEFEIKNCAHVLPIGWANRWQRKTRSSVYFPQATLDISVPVDCRDEAILDEVALKYFRLDGNTGGNERQEVVFIIVYEIVQEKITTGYKNIVFSLLQAEQIIIAAKPHYDGDNNIIIVPWLAAV